MSATPPDDPKTALKKELTSAALWAFGAAVFAVGLFVYAGQVAAEKRTFYYLAGATSAVVAAVNGYSSWMLSQKLKK